jgi:hypothetical protein
MQKEPHDQETLTDARTNPRGGDLRKMDRGDTQPNPRANANQNPDAGCELVRRWYGGCLLTCQARGETKSW